MTSRRGAAILLVLMVCTVMIVGVTIIARARASTAITTHQVSELLRCDQLITASENPILHWLEEQSSSIIIDPESDAPTIAVHGSQFDLDDSEVKVQITGWDQQGMWPGNSDSVGLQPPVALNQNLDKGDHLARLESETGVYPSRPVPDTIGGLVATHNPWPTSTGRTRGRGVVTINVNTAPQALLNQFSARYDVGDLAALMEKRSQGEFVATSQSARNAEGEEIRLASVSRVWSFRTQVTVGQVTRSVWSVYANQGGQWQLVQRTVIGEPNE